MTHILQCRRASKVLQKYESLMSIYDCPQDANMTNALKILNLSCFGADSKNVYLLWWRNPSSTWKQVEDDESYVDFKEFANGVNIFQFSDQQTKN